MKVLFDTNIIIDALLTDRTKGFNYSQKLLLMAADKVIDGYISSKQITDIYYILRKYLDEEKRRKTIRTLSEVFTILPLIPSYITYCVNSSIIDYEDAILDETAKVNVIPFIVTNNSKDFINSKVGIISPEKLLTLVQTTINNPY